MCIILIGNITKEQHNQAKATNRDGFSLYNEELGLIKAPNEEQIKQALNKFGIWHYRIGTSGKMDETGIHPFKVCKGKYLLYHNGVLGNGKGNLSDTAALAKTLYNMPIGTIVSTLQALSEGQRFVLVSAKNPRNFRLFGKWVVDGGVIMSHDLYPRIYGNKYYGFIHKEER